MGIYLPTGAFLDLLLTFISVQKYFGKTQLLLRCGAVSSTRAAWTFFQLIDESKKDLKENRQRFKKDEVNLIWRPTAWEVSIASESLRERGREVWAGICSTRPPPFRVHHCGPPLGWTRLCSPSTRSHPSLLRFHFNRWSFSLLTKPYGKIWLRRTGERKVKGQLYMSEYLDVM